jgi:hypothetical protein
MSIAGDNRLYGFETRCKVSAIKAGGERAWQMRLSCEGEGEKFSTNPRISITRDGRLVIENRPVGQSKRDVYVRCDGPKVR